MDAIKRDRLIQELSERSDETLLISLNEFFDGNDDEGSIGCNLSRHPGVPTFRSVLQRVAARMDVQNVLVQVNEVDPGFGAWPFSDVVYVVGDIEQEVLKQELAVLEPDEVEPMTKDLPAPFPGSATKIFFVWWD